MRDLALQILLFHGIVDLRSISKRYQRIWAPENFLDVVTKRPPTRNYHNQVSHLLVSQITKKLSLIPMDMSERESTGKPYLR